MARNSPTAGCGERGYMSATTRNGAGEGLYKAVSAPPRTWLGQPDQFGHVKGVVWKKGAPGRTTGRSWSPPTMQPRFVCDEAARLFHYKRRSIASASTPALSNGMAEGQL